MGFILKLSLDLILTLGGFWLYNRNIYSTIIRPLSFFIPLILKKYLFRPPNTGGSHHNKTHYLDHHHQHPISWPVFREKFTKCLHFQFRLSRSSRSSTSCQRDHFFLLPLSFDPVTCNSYEICLPALFMNMNASAPQTVRCALIFVFINNVTLYQYFIF